MLRTTLNGPDVTRKPNFRSCSLSTMLHAITFLTQNLQKKYGTFLRSATRVMTTSANTISLNVSSPSLSATQSQWSHRLWKSYLSLTSSWILVSPSLISSSLAQSGLNFQSLGILSRRFLQTLEGWANPAKEL